MVPNCATHHCAYILGLTDKDMTEHEKDHHQKLGIEVKRRIFSFLHGAHRLIDFKGFRNLPNCLDFLVFNDNTVTRYIQGWKIPLIILSACSANSFLLLMKTFPDLTSRYTAFFKVPPIPSTGPFWWRRSL